MRKFVISNISYARTLLETWYLDLSLMHNILGLDSLVGLGFHGLSSYSLKFSAFLDPFFNTECKIAPNFVTIVICNATMSTKTLTSLLPLFNIAPVSIWPQQMGNW